jgi:hypothetical protein
MSVRHGQDQNEGHPPRPRFLRKPDLSEAEGWAAAPPAPEGWRFHHRRRVRGPSLGLAFVKLDFLIGTKWGPTPGEIKKHHPDARTGSGRDPK